MSTAGQAADSIPDAVRRLPLGERIAWARKHRGLSHDRLIEKLGRSNRGHLIKIEKGAHVPRVDLREALAGALDVPVSLFLDDEEVTVGDPFRDVRRPAPADRPRRSPRRNGDEVTA